MKLKRNDLNNVGNQVRFQVKRNGQVIYYETRFQVNLDHQIYHLIIYQVIDQIRNQVIDQVWNQSFWQIQDQVYNIFGIYGTYET